MSFNLTPNNAPYYSLGPGAAGRYGIQYGVGTYHGAQWIQAYPAGPGFLQVSDFGIESSIVVPNSLQVSYWVTVTTIGDDIALFSLTGGGNV
jgi:hypothetical protein